MTVAEAGKVLTEARVARGLSLLDVERDTRISTKYLKALEQGSLDIIPAPVYARAFMRTYAQYLGLNAPSLVQRLPGAKPEPEMPPLPVVGTDGGMPLLSPSWVIAGVVVLGLFIGGLALFWTRGDDGGSTVSNGAPSSQVSEGAEQSNPPAGEAPAAPVVQTGEVPDLASQPVLVAANALIQADMPYMIIEVENKDAPQGTVFEQNPAPGTATEGDTVVTLLVSR